MVNLYHQKQGLFTARLLENIIFKRIRKQTLMVNKLSSKTIVKSFII